MPELSGLLAARTRLRPGGSQGHREYRGQHLRRSGFGRYGQDVERALRQDRAAADLQLAEQRQPHHLDQYAARQPDSRLEDLQPLARHVRGCRGGQLRRTHRAEDLPRRDRHRQGEARRRDGVVRSDPEISSFRDADGVDRMEEIIRRNYTQIKEDVTQIIKRELRRIAEDPALRHLLAKK